MPDITRDYPVRREQRVPHEDWDRGPWNRHTFQQVREYVPTTEVWRGNGPVRTLECDPKALDDVEFGDADGDKTTMQQWIHFPE